MGALPALPAVPPMCCCSTAAETGNSIRSPANATGSSASEPELEVVPEPRPISNGPTGLPVAPLLELHKTLKKPSSVVHHRLRFTVVGATGLRNADWGPWWNKSDPYCTMEIPGKPLSFFITDHIKDTLNPTWNAMGTFADYEPGDTLHFQIFDKDVNIKKDDFLGEVTLPSHVFHTKGFDGSLPLRNAGDGIRAFLKVKILPVDKAETPRHSSDAIGAETTTTTATTTTPAVASLSEKPRVALKPSGNKNKPEDYIWLEEPLERLVANDAAGLKCKVTATGQQVTPIFFLIGACPSTLPPCGMQSMMFSADADMKVHFWWVKPDTQRDGKVVNSRTLNENSEGKDKNDPGRSKPFHHPLADLFEKGILSRSWRFGMEQVEAKAGPRVPRAYVQNEPEDGSTGPRLFLYILWQEDWTSNPFARQKYIKGKLVYQKNLGASEYWIRQYEILDGAAHIDDYEEGPISSVLPEDDVKRLWDVDVD